MTVSLILSSSMVRLRSMSSFSYLYENLSAFVFPLSIFSLIMIVLFRYYVYLSCTWNKCLYAPYVWITFVALLMPLEVTAFCELSILLYWCVMMDWSWRIGSILTCNLQSICFMFVVYLRFYLLRWRWRNQDVRVISAC